MKFEKGYIYHIYNQGNNRRKIFFKRDNYLFFLKKVNTHILPFGDVLAWCLMPNHFHLMVFVRSIELSHKSIGVVSNNADAIRTFNQSIGIMLRSYSQAVNKQQNFSGKLIREKTKAECVNCIDRIEPSFITKSGVSQINIIQPEKEYSQICFNYIHDNPVKAKLVERKTDWEFSSAKDYSNLRDGKLINKELAKEYKLIF